MSTPMELWLFKDQRIPDRAILDVALREHHGLRGIRCPLCLWRPAPSSRWCCLCDGTPEPSFAACGTVWNTFLTGGCCPGCGHLWRWTSCLRCGEWSLHDDWYEESERQPKPAPPQT